MRAIRKKMQSQRGASITFALLLFLVCAVLSAVIVVASTTAAGRMSRLPETDQRYFAVTSAAELLKDMIEGQKVSVVNKRVTDYTVPFVNGTEGEPTMTNLPIEDCYLIYGDGIDELVPQNQVKGDGTLDLYRALKTIPGDAAYRYVNDKNSLDKSRTLSFTSAGGNEALTVNAVETVTKGGMIQLELEKDQFQLKLVFSPSISGPSTKYSSTYGPIENKTIAEDGTVSYTEQRTDTVITTTTFSWTLSRIVTW